MNTASTMAWQYIGLFCSVLMICGSIAGFWRDIRDRKPGFVNLLKALLSFYHNFPLLLFWVMSAYAISMTIMGRGLSAFAVLLWGFALGGAVIMYLDKRIGSTFGDRKPGTWNFVVAAFSAAGYWGLKLLLIVLTSYIFYILAEPLLDRPQKDTETVLSCFKRSPSGAVYPLPVGKAERKAFAMAGVLPGMTEKEALRAMREHFDIRHDCALRIDGATETWTKPQRQEDVSYMTEKNYWAACGDQQYDIFLSVLNTGEKVLRVRKVLATDGSVIDCKSDTRRFE